jgi:hypothetical protein
MLPCHGERVEGRKARCLLSGFNIEFRADPPGEFCLTAFGRQHSGQEKQVAGVYGLHIDAERLRRRRQLDRKFPQPLLGAGRPRALERYHFPTCAPPSTCNTFPVTWPASVR